MMSVFLAASTKSYEDFASLYQPEDSQRLDEHGRSLWMYALANPNPAERYAIARLLLRDECPLGGPGPRGASVLHVLFGQTKHDITEDASLAGQLIALGADVNAVDDANRLVFTEVIQMKFTDADLEPIFDLWFAQPRLDFTTESVDGLSPLRAAEQRPFRASILERMQTYGT